MSARHGDNVSARSERTPWYAGPPLLDYLETVDVEDERAAQPFRLPVQWVNRPNLDFRGFAGTLASGVVRVGDEIVALPSGQVSRVKSILGAGRRHRRGRGRRRRHRDARARDRHRPRRRAGAGARAAAGRRPVRRASGVDVGGAADARPLVSDEDQPRDLGGDRHRPQASHRHRQPRQARRQDPGAERGRRLQPVDRPADRLRPLRRQPHDRRLHPDRPHLERDGRRRHDRFRAAPRDQHPSPDDHRQQDRAHAS